MQIARIEGTTRILGKAQGYYGLPVRDDLRTILEQPSIIALVKEARDWSVEMQSLTHVMIMIGEPGAAKGNSAVASLLNALADALDTLPVSDTVAHFTVPGPDTPVMTTAWHPTPDELTALNAGASIHVELLGQAHPPIMVKCGPLPK